MKAGTRSVRIDVTYDLPQRARPLSTDATSKIFGGCLAQFTNCTQNFQCCSYFCWRMWWISAENRWQYQCLPAERRYN